MIGDISYMYGSDEKVLSQLDMKTFVWSQLWTASETDDGESPMAKDACGLAYFGDDHLALFGGFATPRGPLQPGSAFIPCRFSDGGGGWTNEFHIFNIKLSESVL